MKQYYTVLVASQQYHGTEALTYSSDADVPLRSVVRVPMQRQLILGVVTGITGKPRFATKDIADIFELPPLPAELVTLAEWILAYYPAPMGMVTGQIMPATLTAKTIGETGGLTADIAPLTAQLPPLTSEQTSALETMAVRDTFVLHGDTGTGKTAE